MKRILPIFSLVCLFLIGCNREQHQDELQHSEKIRVILDADANNELDDQHAIAYLLFNGEVFDVEGITVNKTRNGGSIDDHFNEAKRVVQMCGADTRIKVLKGAEDDFNDIKNHINDVEFDGAQAVNFIIKRALEPDKPELTVFMLGKITNIALALYKEPRIASRLRIVWGASNYPAPGGYNWSHDHPAIRYVLKHAENLEIVPCRFRRSTGSDAVRVRCEDMEEKMKGKGVHVTEPVSGRHGGMYHCFGDYSANLFEQYRISRNKNAKALYDVVILAVSKNSGWGDSTHVAVPDLINRKWVAQPANPKKMVVWENFNKTAILEDFFSSMDN